MVLCNSSLLDKQRLFFFICVSIDDTFNSSCILYLLVALLLLLIADRCSILGERLSLRELPGRLYSSQVDLYLSVDRLFREVLRALPVLREFTLPAWLPERVWSG